MTVCDCFIENARPRISGRVGNLVDLNVDFYNNGKLDNPYWIQRVEIYRCKVTPENLVVVIPFSAPDDDIYPAPACTETITVPISECGTEPDAVRPVPGKYHLPFMVPATFKAPDVYIDVWYFYPRNPCLGDEYPADCVGPVDDSTTGCDPLDPALQNKLVTCCHRFWVYPDAWMCDDGLQTVNFSFEALNVRFNNPEVKPLEVGLIPLPVYTYNKTLVDSLMPYLQPSITIGTQHCETLVSDMPMELGIRQGTYRSNPWVVRWNLDTNEFLRGSYWYKIKLTFPNGQTRVSQKYWFEIR